jgi:hypothetical protein
MCMYACTRACWYVCKQPAATHTYAHYDAPTQAQSLSALSASLQTACSCMLDRTVAFLLLCTSPHILHTLTKPPRQRADETDTDKSSVKNESAPANHSDRSQSTDNRIIFRALKKASPQIQILEGKGVLATAMRNRRVVPFDLITTTCVLEECDLDAGLRAWGAGTCLRV